MKTRIQMVVVIVALLLLSMLLGILVTRASAPQDAPTVVSWVAPAPSTLGCICENRKWVCNGKRTVFSCRPPRRR